VRDRSKSAGARHAKKQPERFVHRFAARKRLGDLRLEQHDVRTRPGTLVVLPLHTTREARKVAIGPQIINRSSGALPGSRDVLCESLSSH
jgi:hypothetical protein